MEDELTVFADEPEAAQVKKNPTAPFKAMVLGFGWINVIALLGTYGMGVAYWLLKLYDWLF